MMQLQQPLLRTHRAYIFILRDINVILPRSAMLARYI